MNKLKVEAVFEKFEKVKALVIGDGMIDSYLWGTVDRISPEAPVPIIIGKAQESRLGGAGNVSMNLKSLGATPILVSLIGDDMHGEIFQQLLKKRNLSNEGIIQTDTRRTTLKTRILSGNQQVVRVDEEVSDYIDPELEQQVLDRIESLIEKHDFQILIFVDYDKGVVTPKIIERVITLAKANDIQIAVDPKFRNFSSYKNVDLFKPNFNEFKRGIDLNLDKNDLDSVLSAAEALKAKNGCEIIFVSLSELGVMISNGVTQNHFPAEIRDIADVSGAGDTVIAVASLCLAANLSTKIMAQLSNLAGGLVCEKSGVVPIDCDRLKHEATKVVED